jgi:hypothetical protein
MKNFQIIDTFNPALLLNQINRNPQLWNAHTLRTTHQNSPHTAISDIWVRFNDTKAYESAGDVASIMDQHESIWYPAAEKLPALRPLVFALMGRVEGIRLGRVLVTKLAPGKKIDAHVDSGDHAAYYDRYHFVLQGLPGSIFRCGEEIVQMPSGTVWWFQNQIEHEVINNSADDRIHMIVDVKI